MYSYSPIEEIYIKNFRNIGEAVIDFKDSPIVCLVGENEAGKTSVIKAFEVCALHANPRDQKDYIRDGTKMFGVAIKLEDGTVIKRVKMDTVNKYAVEYPDGSVWDTTKLSEGLPIQVQQKMGLIEEPETKEFLHVRTYEDKLLFVVTPASTNYKVMYDALKVDQLTKAIKKGSVEVNSLRSEINNNEYNINAFTNTIKNIHIHDISILQKVKDRLKSQMSLLDKLEKAIELKDAIDSSKKALGSLSAIEDGTVHEIDVSITSKLLSASRLINKRNEITSYLNSLREVNNLEEINLDLLSKLKSLIDKRDLLSKKVKDAEMLCKLNELSEINELEYSQLCRAVTLLNQIKLSKSKNTVYQIENCREIRQDEITVLSKLQRIKELDDYIKRSSTSIEQINTYVSQVLAYMEQCGVAVTTCPNCGESVVIDKELL